jgi:ribonuclease HI
MENNIHIFTDGGSRGNPGPSACAFVIKNDAGKILEKRGKKLGIATNNVAEYQAIILALEYLLNEKEGILKNIAEINFYSDSKLVVSQLNGLFKIKDPSIRGFVFDIHNKESEVDKKITYNLIPREKNSDADWEVNVTLDSR